MARQQRELDLSDLLGGGPPPTFDFSISIPLAQPHEAVVNLSLGTIDPEAYVPGRSIEADALKGAIREYVGEREERTRTSGERSRPSQRWQPPAKTGASAGGRTRYGRGHRSLRPL